MFVVIYEESFLYENNDTHALGIGVMGGFASLEFVHLFVVMLFIYEIFG